MHGTGAGKEEMRTISEHLEMKKRMGTRWEDKKKNVEKGNLIKEYIGYLVRFEVDKNVYQAKMRPIEIE